MRFLRETGAQSLVEWLTGAMLVVAVVGTIIYLIATTTKTEGAKTNTWIENIPDP
jgi:hypothetical protein